MNINDMSYPEHNEKPGSIDEIAKTILDYLQKRQTEINNAIAGERPDENGRYSENYYQAKDQRDQINAFVEIVREHINKNSKNETPKHFIQHICQLFQQFPTESYKPLINFIESTFSIPVAPQKGPTIFYQSWVKHWSEHYGVETNDIQEIMPFEKFTQQDTASRIQAIMDAFDTDW
ncbi:hypothetical protein GF369_02825 [Candidatus Peregrinibacteria bacterium]|nr:hypothetical protein [Candidatus Peregrinibacteria bacterium]